jgi:hypothetical protein
VVIAALALCLLGLPAEGTVAPAALATPAPSADPCHPDGETVANLYEFTTRNGAFYTLDKAEGAKGGFSFTYVAAKLTKGGAVCPSTHVIHRLRLKTGSSYMLSFSPGEIHNPDFVDDGVMGHTYVNGTGNQVMLLRYSRNGQWRVVQKGQEGHLPGTGWHLDGPMGFADRT